jgi:hypothetical protein
MANQLMTAGSELSVLVPEIWSRRYYDVLLSENVFNALVSRDYEGEIQAVGDTVKISTFPEFGEGDIISEGAAADAESVTVTQQSLVIDSRIVKDFILTNRAMLQSLPAMEKLQELCAYSINKKIQSKIIELTVPSASAPDHQIAYDSGTTLALADILEAKELLDTQDVPMSDRHAVMGAAQLNDVFNITGFTSSDFLIDGAPVQTGQLPSALLGFMPHFTTTVANTSYWFHRSFFTMAAQQGMAISIYDLGVEGKRAARINCDVLVGFKQLDDERVVTLS